MSRNENRFKKKSIQIQVEFNHLKDLNVVFEEIKKQLRYGENYGRKQIEESIFYEYNLQYSKVPDYREEKINDAWCMVIKSKIK
jgi:hypothetical protein